MLVKLILISTIWSFVYVRSIETSGELKRLFLIGDSRLVSSMDAESTNTEQRLVRQVSNTPKIADGTLPQPTERVPVMNHESMHPAVKHPKKRAMNYKEDDQVDLRPGCCG
ncbi:uncharacterized protein LOC143264600 [Megachile rotundata]|uniref:uncharacterized protein LOC143264600 n=1 Tax=Megachile rotundata TaxID=143995 RepID=UPI003FD6AF1F